MGRTRRAKDESNDKESTNLVRYGSYDFEEAEKEAEELDTGESVWLKFEVGPNRVRILPPPMGQSSPFRVVYQHYVNLPGKKDAVVLVCPRVMADAHCPICQKANELKATGNKADRNRAYELFAKRRVFANVIDREDEASGPKIMGFGKTVHEQLTAIRKADPEDDFTHPVEGFDLTITRKGTGKYDTEYTVVADRRSSTLSDDVAKMQGWIDSQHDLDRLAQVLPHDEFMARLRGEDPREREREDDSEEPRRRRPRGRTAEDDAIDVDAHSTDEDDNTLF